MIDILENGHVIRYLEREIKLPERALTQTEKNYEIPLRNMGYHYVFPHPIFETVTDLGTNHTFLAEVSNEDGQARWVVRFKRQLEQIGQKLPAHFLQIPKAFTSIPERSAYGYVEAQINGGFEMINILDREMNGRVETLREDINKLIGRIQEAKRTPRLLIDMACPNDNLFREKCLAAHDAGIRFIIVRYRSIRKNLLKFRIFSSLEQDGIVVQMGGLERRLRGRRLPPVSLPSLVSSFGVKTFSIRSYPNPQEEIEYEGLRLFDEPTLGLFNRAEQTERYGDEFVTDSEFTPFDDMSRQGIYSLCSERELHQPIYAYETVASRYELQRSSDFLRSNRFNEYADEKECLKNALQLFGIV